MVSERDYYSVDVIFRGLCMAVPREDETGMQIFLVDARRPAGRPTSDPTATFREHYGAIEVLYKNLVYIETNDGVVDPRSVGCGEIDDDVDAEPLPLPKRFIKVRKPAKHEVGIHFIEEEDIRFHAEKSRLEPSFEIIRRGVNSYDNLPQLSRVDRHGGKPDPRLFGDPPTSNACLARVFLKAGEVRSERLSEQIDESSRTGRSPLVWAFVANNGNNGSPRQIHLDAKVTFKIPKDETFNVEVERFRTEGRRLFALRPSPGEDLKLWIKNRELDLMLSESDELTEFINCEETSDIDIDFELLYKLLARNPEDVQGKRIFHTNLDGGIVTGGGCACGTCGGGTGS